MAGWGDGAGGPNGVGGWTTTAAPGWPQGSWLPPAPPPTPPPSGLGRGGCLLLTLLVVVAMVAVAALSVRSWGNGPGSSKVRYDAEGSVVTTQPSVAVRGMPVGTCVLWDQPSGDRATPKVVGCDEPHFVELLGPMTIDTESSAFPTHEERNAIERRICGPVARDYLGYELQDWGRFSVSSFFPRRRSWERGERTLVCNLQHAQLTMEQYEHGLFLAYRGRVEGQDQALLRAPGTCLAPTKRGYGPAETSCDDDRRTLEVTGQVDVRRMFHPPTTVAEANWRADVACARIAEQYLKHRVPSTVVAYARDITQSDFAIGAHVTNCVITA